MGFNKFSVLVVWVFWVLLFMNFEVHSEVSVKFLEFPNAFSNSSSATFVFDVLNYTNEGACVNCSITCKLDDNMASESDCESRNVSYIGLQDGNYTFEVCTKGFQGDGCTTYNWIVDTVPPTASITASTSFTNAQNISVNISFSEPCTGGGGFRCLDVNVCNLLVYGEGKVMPSTLTVLQPNLTFSILVELSSNVEYGRVILVMDKNFCTDNAGNVFTRTPNSFFTVHFDRRKVYVNLRTHVPEKLLQLDSVTRTVQATNKDKNLKVYLYFSKPVLNSSAEVLNSLNTSDGLLVPTNSDTLGNQRFGFLVENVPDIAIVTITLDSVSIVSRQGTLVSAVAPVTFLYDKERPTVTLRTSTKRTRERSIPISIKFVKPVFDFNSSHISISGGHVQNFRQISRAIYTAEIHADDDIISVDVPENVTGDVAGNRNRASNILQVRHYSIPMISSLFSTFVAAAFGLTTLAAGVLTLSTASLQSVDAFPMQSAILMSEPSRNLFRILCHIQIFALSRWLAVNLPIEYNELVRGLGWSVPYLTLPWEDGNMHPIMIGSPSTSAYNSKILDPGHSEPMQPEDSNQALAAPVYGLPLTPIEYKSFFESQDMKPEAEILWNPHNSHGWRDFKRIMFWLAVIGGSLILLHALLVLILRLKKICSETQKNFGALTFPRFEIFLVIVALPSICMASGCLLKGSAPSGVIVAVLLLGIVLFFILTLFLFLSVGITFGKLLQYKEVHQVGRKFHWYQELVRVTLGPGKRGQWTWKNQPNSVCLILFGPLFEDLRGPPKYMLSQISGASTHKDGDQIIASDDENEDAEATFIQKLFGILRIYYTLLESVKRVCLGILAGAYLESWSLRTPAITLLSITCFQLLFLVLKKPFIKKKVQLVEIISVSCEMGLFATCLVLLEINFSYEAEKRVGIFMLMLFLVGFLVQLMNEWYALYRQTKRLDTSENNFSSGLKLALVGFLLLFIPQKFVKCIHSIFPSMHSRDGQMGVSIPGNGNRVSQNSGRTEKPWMKQLRELARDSFSRDRSSTPNDPSTSNTRWNGSWSGNRSGSSFMTSSSDYKSRPEGLYKDLRAIFASK
ncbi:Bacterial Ig-like domain 12 [Dillenia turbinata]|uniref:Bacterial Ig-like domain 12 n=1 Tax=Dillenia turbinata TaxID=194707 RepID=A0AAN8Z8V9_9MAGN